MFVKRPNHVAHVFVIGDMAIADSSNYGELVIVPQTLNLINFISVNCQVKQRHYQKGNKLRNKIKPLTSIAFFVQMQSSLEFSPFVA